MIVVDVETTGIDSKKNSIVSIGAVDFSNPQNQFYQECRIWEGAEIAQQALYINGFKTEQITDQNKMSLEEAVKSFINWAEDIDEQTLAGENPSFDRAFLRYSVEKYKLNYRIGYRTIDLHSVCYADCIKQGLIPPTKDNRTDLNTDGILMYVGLPKEPKPHNALTGAKMEAEAFSRIIYKKSLLKEFEKYSMPDYLKQSPASSYLE